jgi:hypothetical protein
VNGEFVACFDRLSMNGSQSRCGVRGKVAGVNREFVACFDRLSTNGKPEPVRVYEVRWRE